MSCEMKSELRFRFFKWVMAVLLLFMRTFVGCSEGTVPNATSEEIESAKFDAEQANEKGIGSAIPPD